MSFGNTNPFNNTQNTTYNNNYNNSFNNNTNNFAEINTETLFNDLPEEIKKSLVELRNLSQKKYTFGMSHPLKNTCENITVPDCTKLHDEFSNYVSIFNQINGNVIVSQEYFQKEIAEFTEFRDFYNNNMNNKDIVDEFEATIAMMDKKYSEIKENYIKKTK